MQSKTVSGLTAIYEESKMYLEGHVNTHNGPKNTLWTRKGMNLEYPEWDFQSFREEEEKLRDALTNKK